MPKFIIDYPGLAGVGKYESDALTGIHEAGNPFYDWFFGGDDAARMILEERKARSSSETSLSRVTIPFYEDSPVGGFIGLSGAELQACRKADMLALMKEKKADSSFNLTERFSAARELFPQVAPEVYYLSKIWVAPDFRGQGLGRKILQGFLETGRAAGFKTFQLDVSADNTPAVRLYQACGFQMAQKSCFPQANLEYLSMELEEE